MAKQARLEPKKNNGPEAAPWYVEVPQSLSETGRRQRLFFPTRQKAQAECERLKARKHNFGVSLQRLSANQIVEAAQAFELLKDYPQLSLKEAVRAHLEVLAARAKSIPFDELFELFLVAKSAKSPKYLRQLRYAWNRFKTLHPLPV
jgi:hypothetical protein